MPISINLKDAKEQLIDAQKIRNALAGGNLYKKLSITEIDTFLQELCKDGQLRDSVEEISSNLDFLPKISRVPFGWYSGDYVKYLKTSFKNSPQYKEGQKVELGVKLTRVDQARIILFRETIMYVAMGYDPWYIVSQVIDISGLQEYKKASFINLNLEYDHFFYHEL